MTRYELIRCSDCHHERVRRAEGQRITDCQTCGSEDQEVFDLIAVERDDHARFGITPEGAIYADMMDVDEVLEEVVLRGLADAA